MADGIIKQAVMQSVDLDISAKAIYAYLCCCQVTTRQTLCNDLGITNHTLTKYLNQLEDNGLISVEWVKTKGWASQKIMLKGCTNG